jgi:ATP-dependent protease HslVU (ClpYQ) peptidase subunit
MSIFTYVLNIWEVHGSLEFLQNTLQSQLNDNFIGQQVYKHTGQLWCSGSGEKMEGRTEVLAVGHGRGFTESAALDEIMTLAKEIVGRRLSQGVIGIT